MDNVEFVKGYIEDIPLADDCVDVVISNCVINLAADKREVLAEAARVLRPGGPLRRLGRDRRPRHGRGHARGHAAVDRLHRRRAHPRPSSKQRSPTRASADIEIRETHRVHEHASSAIVRARKPEELTR